MSLEEEFTQDMVDLYRSTGEATGYWPNYFRREVKKKGGLAVAKRLLQPQRGISKGFDKLIEVRRADLSLEFIVLNTRFSILFTPAELVEARKRLHQLNESAFPGIVPPASIQPETLDPDRDYVEERYVLS